MYLLYSFLLTIGICALLPLFLLDALRHGKYVASLRERTGRVPRVETQGQPLIWLHCVSVGETQAARPLARTLLKRFPAHALVVSTTTLTGQRLAREVFRDEAAEIIYFPFDWAWSVRRTLDAIKPSVVLLMETELWPRFLRECRRRDIPVAIVNGRISERSLRGYRRLGLIMRRIISDLALAIMQTEADAARMRALGLADARVSVSGNLKFDVDTEINSQALTEAIRARFNLDDASLLVVAASTHAPEEAIFVEAFKQIRAAPAQRQARLLVAPRHPERFDEVASLLQASGLMWARRSSKPQAADVACEAILLDTIGELRAVYPLAALVFVGGSIARSGGHNVLEPAAAAKCIITGAHTFNFAAIVRAFREQDALVQLPDIAERQRVATTLARTLHELLSDDERRRRIGANARTVLEQNRGATARTVERLAPLFDQRPEIKS